MPRRNIHSETTSLGDSGAQRERYASASALLLKWNGMKWNASSSTRAPAVTSSYQQLRPRARRRRRARGGGGGVGRLGGDAGGGGAVVGVVIEAEQKVDEQQLARLGRGNIMHGMQWNAMEWNAMQCNAMECNGIEWNGMEWNGMEWNGMQLRTTACAPRPSTAGRSARGNVIWHNV